VLGPNERLSSSCPWRSRVGWQIHWHRLRFSTKNDGFPKPSIWPPFERGTGFCFIKRVVPTTPSFAAGWRTSPPGPNSEGCVIEHPDRAQLAVVGARNPTWGHVNRPAVVFPEPGRNDNRTPTSCVKQTCRKKLAPASQPRPCVVFSRTSCPTKLRPDPKICRHEIAQGLDPHRWRPPPPVPPSLPYGRISFDAACGGLLTIRLPFNMLQRVYLSVIIDR